MMLHSPAPAPLFRSPAALIAMIAAALMMLGIVMVYSASGARAGYENRRVLQAQMDAGADAGTTMFHHSADYARRQITFGVVGIIAMIAAMILPMEWIERWSPAILLFSLFLLVLVVATPLGFESRGARRWMRLGPFTLQPSEFAKIGLVIYMSRFLSEKRHVLREFKRGFVPAIGIFGAFALLIVLEKDLGMTALTAAVVVGMWVLARMSTLHLSTIVLGCLCAGTMLVFQQSYRINRVLAFLDPDKYAMTFAYQLNQSLIAVGSGGVFGRGLGFGLQKYHFLSEAHTDFIFAIVCEELGLIGSISIVALFISLILLGFRVSSKAPDLFGSLLAAGLTMTIGWAAIINFFVVLGLAPTKGIALPFFSYGGSSLLATLICIGLLLNVANYTFSRNQDREVPA